jgi:hypothetical protein
MIERHWSMEDKLHYLALIVVQKKVEQDYKLSRASANKLNKLL